MELGDTEANIEAERMHGTLIVPDEGTEAVERWRWPEGRGVNRLYFE